MNQDHDFGQVQGVSYQQARSTLPAGWADLVAKAYHNFRAFNGTVVVEQVKPKFGEMRLYFRTHPNPDLDNAEDLSPNTLSGAAGQRNDERQRLQKQINQLSDQSLQTCQSCGRQALKREEHKHVATLCAWHAFMMTHTSVRSWELGRGPVRWQDCSLLQQALEEPRWISQHLDQTGGVAGPPLGEDKARELLRAGLLFVARQAWRQGEKKWIQLLARAEPSLALRELQKSPRKPSLCEAEERALETLLGQGSKPVRRQALRLASQVGLARKPETGKRFSP